MSPATPDLKPRLVCPHLIIVKSTSEIVKKSLEQMEVLDFVRAVIAFRIGRFGFIAGHEVGVPLAKCFAFHH